MTNTSKSGLDTLFTTNTAGDISPTDLRDFVDTAIGARRVTTITATDTLDRDDDVVLCDATSGAITVNLPAVASYTHKLYTIVKTDSGGNAVTLDGNSSDNINGSGTYALTAQWKFATIICDGSKWVIIAVN